MTGTTRIAGIEIPSVALPTGFEPVLQPESCGEAVS
jgi:hypothetical protein